MQGRAGSRGERARRGEGQQPLPYPACAPRRKMGLQSLPVAFGVDTAKWITVGTIDVTQFAVAAYLAFGLHEPVYAAVLTALILPQVPP